jgi:Uncharacterized conserved protein (COG2071).
MAVPGDAELSGTARVARAVRSRGYRARPMGRRRVHQPRRVSLPRHAPAQHSNSVSSDVRGGQPSVLRPPHGRRNAASRRRVSSRARPRPAIALVAQLTYNEPYRAVAMRHRIDATSANATPRLVEYGWRTAPAWSRMRVEPTGESSPLEPGSEEEFIIEHFWGYTRQRDGSTVEYEVRHPPWRVWRLRSADLDDDSNVFDAPFAGALRRAPHSAFLADGSAVSVYMPTRLG